MNKTFLRKICSVSLSLLLVFTGFTVFGAKTAPVSAAATGSKFLGNVIGSSVPSDFANYWDQVTPENASKWGSVESTRNVMNWSNVDLIYNYCKTNGFPFKFHNLVWGSQEPSWVSGLSAADQKTAVTQWIQAAGARYPNADLVDVVNEPLHTPPDYKNAIGGDGTTGWDWVVWAFQQARAAFPNSKLLINEYGIISDPNEATSYINIINILKSRGLIDGIGIQCHYFNMNTVSVSTMNTVLNMLSATGLPIYVSELDMSGDDATQLSLYQQKFPVLWENPDVQGVTLWGYIQGQTWADNTYLVNSNGSERPALQWLMSYVGGQTTGPQNSQLGITSAQFDLANPASINVPVQFNGNTLTSISYGASTLRSGTDYTVSGSSVTLEQSWLSTLTTAASPATLTFVFSAGSNATLPITVTDSGVTPPPQSGNLKVEMYNGNTSPTINGIMPRFRITNTGSSAISLSSLKLRYYYTEDGTQAQNFWCDWSTAGSANVTGTFVKLSPAATGADTYLEVGFTSAAGSLAPGQDIEVQARFSKSDWSNYTQTGDYSFNASSSSYAVWNDVTAYLGGTLAWGTEP